MLTQEMHKNYLCHSTENSRIRYLYSSYILLAFIVLYFTLRWALFRFLLGILDFSLIFLLFTFFACLFRITCYSAFLSFMPYKTMIICQILFFYTIISINSKAPFFSYINLTLFSNWGDAEPKHQFRFIVINLLVLNFGSHVIENNAGILYLIILEMI